MGEWNFGLLEVFQYVFVGGLLVLLMPFRRRVCFSVSRFVAAPPELVWKIACDVPEISAETTERPPAVPDNLLSYRKISESPEIIEKIYDLSGGNRWVLSTEKMLVLERDAPHRFVHQLWELNGKPHPCGEGSYFATAYDAVDEGTQITEVCEADVRSLLHWLTARRAVSKRLDHLVSHFAIGPVAQSVKKPWWRSNAFLVTAVTTVAAGLYVGWWLTLWFFALIFLHELGHYAAMRITGQPSVKITVVPFLGGVAVPAQPHKSEFDDAFCSLMGAGFSAFLCAALMFGYRSSGSQVNTLIIGDAPAGGDAMPIILLMTASALALLNIIQLLPFLPLDGGQILRSVLSSWRGPWPRRCMLLVGLAAFVALLAYGDILLAAVIAIGLTQAWWMEADVSTARPMQKSEMAAIGAGYLAVAGLLAWPLMEGRAMMFNPGQMPTATFTELSPDEAMDGSHSAEPRFAVASPEAEHMTRWTYVQGGRVIGRAREDTRVWGAPQRAGRFGWITLEDNAALMRLKLDRKKLRRELVGFVVAQRAGLLDEGAASAIQTGHGLVDTQSFTMLAPVFGRTIEKRCLGFHGMFEANNVYAYGAICRPSATPAPTAVELACVIESMSIDGKGPANRRNRFHCSDLAQQAVRTVQFD